MQWTGKILKIGEILKIKILLLSMTMLSVITWCLLPQEKNESILVLPRKSKSTLEMAQEMLINILGTTMIVCMVTAPKFKDLPKCLKTLTVN